MMSRWEGIEFFLSAANSVWLYCLPSRCTCVFPGPGGTSGGEGGSAEGCLFTWRGLQMAGQPERSGVRWGDVPSGLPRSLGGGGRFLTEKLSHMTDSVTPTYCYCFESNSFLEIYLCCFQLALFPLKTSDPASRLCLEIICRTIFILALYRTKWFVFFSLFKKKLIGFTSWLIHLWTFWSVELFLYVTFREICMCLHSAFLQFLNC